MSDDQERPAYQQQAVDEKRELDGKIPRIGVSLYRNRKRDWWRLTEQWQIMRNYYKILEGKISRF